METTLKQRLLGASLVIALSVVFVPMLIDTDDTLNLEDKSLPNPPTFSTDDELPNLNQARERVAALPAKPVQQVVPENEAIDDEPVQAKNAPQVPAPTPAPNPKTTADQAPKADVTTAANPSASTKPVATASAVVPKVETVKAVPAATMQSAVTQAAIPPKVGAEAWAVQVGTFASKDNAQTLVTKLKKSGLTAYMREASGKGRPLVRVYLGPELDKNKAAALQAKLESGFHLKGMIVSYKTN